MIVSLDQIVEETSQNPPDVLANLVDPILVARHGGIESNVEAAWKNEVQNRIQDIASGKVQGIPSEEVMARARNIIQR